MKRQCECGNAADEIVFGLRHACEPKPTLPGLVPSWRFVVPAEEPVLRDPHDLDDDERRGF